MVVKQLVLKKRSHYFFSSSLLLLKDFDKTKLKIAQYDCVDRTVYHIDYAKNTSNVNPLYLIIYGSIEEHENTHKYLIIAPIEINNEVSNNYKKVWDEILKKLIKLIILRMF